MMTLSQRHNPTTIANKGADHGSVDLLLVLLGGHQASHLCRSERSCIGYGWMVPQFVS